MNAPSPFDAVHKAWLAKLPAEAEDQGIGLAGQSWLTGYLEDFARDRADAAFLGLDDCTVSDIARQIESRGKIMLKVWDIVSAEAGFDREPWAADAAKRAATVYRERIDELLKSASARGRT